VQEIVPMPNLIKIGATFINMDQVLRIDDLYPRTKEDQMIVRFGTGDEHSLTLAGQEADDLRTWLNSIATNLHSASDLGRRG
jgi:hypothetical protein